ncbi:MAG: hypothetical protein Rhims3KO_11380 [Hyphomicrobiales bacterium]
MAEAPLEAEAVRFADAPAALSASTSMITGLAGARRRAALVLLDDLPVFGPAFVATL